MRIVQHAARLSFYGTFQFLWLGHAQNIKTLFTYKSGHFLTAFSTRDNWCGDIEIKQVTLDTNASETHLARLTASFVFNTDVSVNEAETIQECVQSKDLLSQRTILANHPWVKSVDDEIERIDEELGGVDGREAGEVSPFGAMPQTAYAPTPSAGEAPATPPGTTEA